MGLRQVAVRENLIHCHNKHSWGTKKWCLTSDFVFSQVQANLHKTSTDNSLAVFEEVDAPLAQSVERFHGKEKVNSSILLGGSFCISGPFYLKARGVCKVSDLSFRSNVPYVGCEFPQENL